MLRPILLAFGLGLCTAATVDNELFLVLNGTGLSGIARKCILDAGVPVIVAGEAWIRNKGVTHDATSPADYFRILGQLPFADRLGAAQLARARRYAYHFFFNRMIPLPFIEPKAGYPIYRLKLGRLEDLGPGVAPGLDVICNGILEHTPFVMGETGAMATRLAPSPTVVTPSPS